ncbi:MAG: ABC transporter permease [Acidobacteriota bacterium]|nr:ABC transporter permease [Acidobacteriota bacterium]
MPEVVIHLQDITRTYHVGDIDVHALRGVSLTVERGEFVAIMGASGSGKSTLMSILGCLDRPTGGRYFFEGVDIADLGEPDLARIRSERIGFVFQSFNLLARTSALENVALPLFYAESGPSRRRRRTERARAALALLGLGDREANTPAQLSGGQQQRVAIARALINGPSLLLADEPTGNLDSRTSHQIMDTLAALNREQGLTIVLVTHEPDIAAYADRVLTMVDGELVSDQRNGHPTPIGAAAAAAGPTLSALQPDGAAAKGPAVWSFGAMLAGAAVQAIGRNKMRSALTILGVFIGVAALIAMVAVGQGASAAVKKQIENLGTNLIVVVPGAQMAGGVRGGLGSASTLTVSDAQAIRRDDPAVAQVSYLSRQMGQVQYANRNWTTNIQGVSPNYPPITNWQIAAGRDFTEADEANAALVVLIGQTVYQQLFEPYEDPVGATILVKSTPMRVIGLFAAKGQTPFGQDQDDLVMIPFSTAERKVLGATTPSQAAAAGSTSVYAAPPNPFGIKPQLTGYVNVIYVQAAGPSQVQTTIREVTDTLARRHRIKPGDPNDFNVRNLSQIADTAESSSRTLSLLLATVASISLLVGGIGIMNILLVSVTERTREIGLRMAIGARRLHVLLQFLAEAIFLSVAGGVVGIAVGVAASKIISSVAGWPVQVPPAAVVGGFLFSAAVGVFFGYYPARKASRFDPIEALRYE